MLTSVARSRAPLKSSHKLDSPNPQVDGEKWIEKVTESRFLPKNGVLVHGGGPGLLGEFVTNRS